MTKARPKQPVENMRRRGANVACAEIADVCEWLVAELQQRRVRLQKLLQLARLEAESIPAGRVPIQSHANCGNVHTNRTA